MFILKNNWTKEKININYENLIDFEGWILVIKNEGRINIKKHKTKVPKFNSIMEEILM